MRTRVLRTLTAGVLVALWAAPGRGEVVLQTRAIRLRLSDDAKVTSIEARVTGRELRAKGEPAPAFHAYASGASHPASSVRLVKDRLGVRFAGAGAIATFQVIQRADYVALRLTGVEGKPVDRIDLLSLRVQPLPNRGTWIDVAYDKEFGLCLCGGNVRTHAAMKIGKDALQMTASAYAEVGLKDATAVLFGFDNPAKRFLDVMEIVERDFKMPPGARHRRSAAQKYSYLWVSPTPGDIGEYVEWARRGGFRMILFSYTAFSQGAGHFRWNRRYPGGLADLKKVTDTIRRAGLSAGLHLHYDKAHATDPYVAPVPDDRLGKTRTFTLRSDIDKAAATISVRENPRGYTRSEGMRVLQIDKELIAYKSFTTRGRYEFRGCRRGHLYSAPASHRAGGKVHLLNVDTNPLFIRLDQNTDIQDEVAERIGHIVRQTGPYDMVYFDGAEDVHAPFWYHCANAQYRLWRRLSPAPSVAEAAANTHFSWHMISRSNAHDSVAPDEMKAFCRKGPCRAAPQRARDFTRINFGRLDGFGRSRTEWIGPDVLEYVVSRGAAWDCPFSMRVDLQQIKNNPRAEDCFGVAKIWEDARIGGKLSDAHRRNLRMLDREHHLFRNKEGNLELATISEIPEVAGGKHLKAYSFRRFLQPLDTCVLIWAVVDRAELLLPTPPEGLRVMRPFGTELSVSVQAGKAVIPVSSRRYLIFPDTPVATVKKLLRQAASRAIPAGK